METSNSSITPRIIYMEQEVRGRWSFRTCKYIEGIECHCVLTVFVLYNLSLSLFLFFSPFYSRSPSLEASCHRGQCDTSPFRPVPWLYSRYPRHNAHSVALPAENVPIEQWPPTFCYRASDRKEFDVTKNSTGQWSSFLKSEGVDWWSFESFYLNGLINSLELFTNFWNWDFLFRIFVRNLNV